MVYRILTPASTLVSGTLAAGRWPCTCSANTLAHTVHGQDSSPGQRTASHSHTSCLPTSQTLAWTLTRGPGFDSQDTQRRRAANDSPGRAGSQPIVHFITRYTNSNALSHYVTSEYLPILFGGPEGQLKCSRRYWEHL